MSDFRRIRARVGWVLSGVALCVAGCTAAKMAPAGDAFPAQSPAPRAASVPVAAVATASGDVDGLPVDLANVIAPVIARAKIPGAAAIVLRGDRIVAQGVAGVRKIGAPEKVTLDDRFELCSGAKAMTATLVARLVEEGALRWDTTLAELYAGTLTDIDPAWARVTVLQALAHRAGLEDHLFLFARSMLWAKGEVASLRRQYAAKILARPPDVPPGTRYIYNSTDYLIVAAGLEKLTGRTWEELMREKLFTPLGLATAGFGPPGRAGQVDEPWGHGRRRVAYVPLPGTGLTPFDPGSLDADYPAVGAPAGLVHMSVKDWAKFAALHLRGDPANPERAVRLLRAESFQRLHQAGAGEEYVGGWMTGTRSWARGGRPGDTGRVLFHQGDNGRWNTAIYLAPEINFAVMIACNRASMWGPVDEIAGALVGRFAADARAGR